MYLNFKARNRTFEDRIPLDNLTRIGSGNGWLKRESEELCVVQKIVGQDDMKLVTRVDTLHSAVKEGDFVNFLILTGDIGVSHSLIWDREEWDVYQENDDGKTVARY